MKTEFHARKVNSNESGWTIWNQPYWIIRSGRCNPFDCIELEFDAVRHAINSMLKENWSRDQLAKKQEIDTDGSIMRVTTNEHWFRHDAELLKCISNHYQNVSYPSFCIVAADDDDDANLFIAAKNYDWLMTIIDKRFHSCIQMHFK